MVSVSAILVYRHETSVRGVLGDEQPEEAYSGDDYHSPLPLLSEGGFLNEKSFEERETPQPFRKNCNRDCFFDLGIVNWPHSGAPEANRGDSAHQKARRAV